MTKMKIFSVQTVKITEKQQLSERKGMGYFLTSFFLVAQMAGAGFLALPKSLAYCGEFFLLKSPLI